MIRMAHPDLKVSLVTAICLLVAWGPVFATIAIAIASGFAAARRDRGRQGAKPRE